jgi:ribulose-5-phosphate 4-epimerase/fuculose-1-phosphate aldolase
MTDRASGAMEKNQATDPIGQSIFLVSAEKSRTAPRQIDAPLRSMHFRNASSPATKGGNKRRWQVRSNFSQLRAKLRYNAGCRTIQASDEGTKFRRILMQFRVSPQTLRECSVEEWQARVDLAAAHRLAFMHGFNEGIFNHLTFVVPGHSDRYYQIPFGMHWSEVTASCFMEVGIDDGLVKSGVGDVERSCFCIHAPIHKALPQAKAVFHTHMPYASALTRLQDPRIKEIGQTEVGMSGEIAYDDEYTGPALDPAEGARLARVIGDKSILFMANHGISTVGETVADAYDRLYYIERAAQVQIYAMWTGQPLKKLPEPVVEKTKRTIGGDSLYNPGPAQRHFDALKRILDRKEPDYAS